MEKSRTEIDRDTVDRAKRDSGHFAELYNLYEPRVFGFFCRRLNSREVAKDLTQETFMKAFRSLRRFDHRGYPYSSYLFTIARNLLVNYYRKKKTVSLDDINQHPYFEPAYQKRFDGGLVWKATKSMSLIDRTVLEERYRKGKSIKEISNVVNKSENAVKLILSRARKKLRKHPVAKGLLDK